MSTIKMTPRPCKLNISLNIFRNITRNFHEERPYCLNDVNRCYGHMTSINIFLLWGILDRSLPREFDIVVYNKLNTVHFYHIFVPRLGYLFLILLLRNRRTNKITKITIRSNFSVVMVVPVWCYVESFSFADKINSI